jgi:mannosyltransferase OCH1-like enzyme
VAPSYLPNPRGYISCAKIPRLYIELQEFEQEPMSAKHRLNRKLQAAESLRLSGQFDDARQILAEVAADPENAALGLPTAADLPRRLQSALLKLAKAEKDTVQKAGYRFHLTPPPTQLAPFCRFSTAEKKAIATANRGDVPRIIHQIWVGPNPIPAGTQAWNSHALVHGYEYKLWLESDLQQLGVLNHPAFIRMQSRGDHPGAVDVARYIILKQYGGIYLDCDWYPARLDLSFDQLLTMKGICAMAEDIPRNTGKGGLLLANSLIMAPPSHPVFARVLASLDDVNTTLPGAPAWWATGPLLFTLMCRGGSMTLIDSDIVAGSLPQETSKKDVETWCCASEKRDGGLLLSWKSWIW